MITASTLPANIEEPGPLLQPLRRESLATWCALYMTIEGNATALTTRAAKTQDLKRFLQYFTTATGSDEIRLWTPALSQHFLHHLRREPSPHTGRKLAPATINRVLATLRTTAKWIHAHQPFGAGNPMSRVKDIALPEPCWQGLTELEMNRLLEAAQQLLERSTAKNQWPHRDFALFHVLYATALRVHELLRLDIEQYDGKYLRAVQRKGNHETPEIYLPQAIRCHLERYLAQERGSNPGPLFQTRTGKRLTNQQVDYLLKRMARQANVSLPPQEHIEVHPHLLRHTMLRKVRQEKGLAFAIEYAGHASEKYIRRYTMPSREEKEATLEELFGC